jgi:hypothetical protein
MKKRLHRSISCPIREDLSWSEKWEGQDKGLICCWERGRQKREEEPDLAERAERGELVILAWKGGVEEKLKSNKKMGTFNYLATWQGLRGEDLNIELEEECIHVCTKTQQIVVFSSTLPEDEE